MKTIDTWDQLKISFVPTFLSSGLFNACQGILLEVLLDEKL